MGILSIILILFFSAIIFVPVAFVLNKIQGTGFLKSKKDKSKEEIIKNAAGNNYSNLKFEKIKYFLRINNRKMIRNFLKNNWFRVMITIVFSIMLIMLINISNKIGHISNVKEKTKATGIYNAINRGVSDVKDTCYGISDRVNELKEMLKGY